MEFAHHVQHLWPPNPGPTIAENPTILRPNKNSDASGNVWKAQHHDEVVGARILGLYSISDDTEIRNVGYLGALGSRVLTTDREVLQDDRCLESP